MKWSSPFITGCSRIWPTEMTINTFWKQKRLNVKLIDRVGKSCFPSIKYLTCTPPTQVNGLISENHKSKSNLFCSKTKFLDSWHYTSIIFQDQFYSFAYVLLPFKIILWYKKAASVQEEITQTLQFEEEMWCDSARNAE